MMFVVGLVKVFVVLVGFNQGCGIGDFGYSWWLVFVIGFSFGCYCVFIYFLFQFLLVGVRGRCWELKIYRVELDSN